MGYITGADRYQSLLLPDCVNDYVGENNPVRVIDAFVNSLNMNSLGFKNTGASHTGRPAYHNADLLKLYIYGYINRIRSSRRLDLEATRNLEVIWLLGKLQPDFRTISDFRKNNASALKNTFYAFGKTCMKLNLFQKEMLSVDGTKIRAVNSKDNCYNEEILVKKLTRIQEHISEYLSQMDKADFSEEDETQTQSTEKIQEIINDLNQRKGKYEGYLHQLKESGETQLLLTDPDARRMHTKDGFNCCYNVQAAVDAGSHLIASYDVTNHNTDQGLLHTVASDSKKHLEVEVIEVLADKGYESREDILNCVMNGTIPTVALKYDKTERLFNIPFEEAEIDSVTYSSTAPEDIRKCISAGVLPACYEDSCISVELQQKTALSCFSRNNDGTVTCPMGNILSPVKYKGTSIVYVNKDACRQCTNRCTSSNSFKTVSFSKETQYVPVMMYGSVNRSLNRIPEGAQINPNNHTLFRKDQAEKKVVIHIKPHPKKIKLRMCLSEHPFGTIKWYRGAHYLLCKGFKKASAEMGLSFLAYNMTRAINIIGIKKLIEAM